MFFLAMETTPLSPQGASLPQPMSLAPPPLPLPTAAVVHVSFPEVTSALLESLNQQRLQGQLCDVSIRVQGREFRAHRAVLAASSPYFHDQVLLKGMTSISLPSVMDPGAFETVLASAYTGRLSMAAADIVNFLTVGSVLQMWHIVDKCTELLREGRASAAAATTVATTAAIASGAGGPTGGAGAGPTTTATGSGRPHSSSRASENQSPSSSNYFSPRDSADFSSSSHDVYSTSSMGGGERRSGGGPLFPTSMVGSRSGPSGKLLLEADELSDDGVDGVGMVVPGAGLQRPTYVPPSIVPQKHWVYVKRGGGYSTSAPLTSQDPDLDEEDEEEDLVLTCEDDEDEELGGASGGPPGRSSDPGLSITDVRTLTGPPDKGLLNLYLFLPSYSIPAGKVKLKGEPLNGCSSCWRGLGRGAMKPLYLLLTLGILAVSRCTARLGPSELECWFVEEQGGGRGMLQGVTKRPAVLLLRQGTGEPPPRPDLDSSLYLKVNDPAGSLGDSLKGSVAPSCELNRYVPSPAASDWAAVLTPEPYSPRSLDGTWLVVSLSSPQVCLSSLLQLSQSQSVTSSVTIATAVLTVFSHSPVVLVGPGENATLDLSFTYSPPYSSGASSSLHPPPFGLEWRRQHRGTGQLLLAVTPGLGGQALGSPEGAVAFASWDEEGVKSPWSGNGTLLLPEVKPHQEGTHLATVYLPHLQAQVALKLKIQKPPEVSLTPSPMVWAYPGQAPPELLCLISHFYPLEELQVSWEFQSGTGGGSREAGGQAWRSSYRYHPDGTVSVSAYLRPSPVTVEQHGSRYICVVHHSSLQAKGLSAQVSLEVAGVSGPSLEDGVGLFLSAFLLLGLLRGMEWIMSFRSPAPDTKEKKS